MDFNLGARIKHFRELKGFTQEYMAGLMSMASGSYGNIERNTVDVSYSRLNQITSILGITLSDLFSETNINTDLQDLKKQSDLIVKELKEIAKTIEVFKK